MHKLNSLCRAALSIYVVRLGLFGAVSLTIYAAIYFAATSHSPVALSVENGPLELMQVVFVGSASVMLFFTAFTSRSGRACLTIMGAMAGYATAREMDSVFESLLFDDAYKYVVGLPMFVIVVWAIWQDRSHMLGDWLALSKQPAVTLFAIGGIYLICVCQVLDSTAFWAGASGIMPSTTSPTHPSKQMVEEFCEVFAYLLIAFSGVESMVMIFEQRESESVIESEPSTIKISSWQQSQRRAA